MKHNPVNERVKREYFSYLKEAKGRDDRTIDGVAKALALFEASTGWKDFKKFHREQAKAFKRRLGEVNGARTGERLSKATLHSILRHCRDFFAWLAREPGYRSRIAYSDADYFSLSDKDVAIATAKREKLFPALAQVELVLSVMPTVSVTQRRDRALVALAMITGARVGALATFRLRDLNVDQGYVDQDARHVRTKFSKTFRTYFMPVSEAAELIVRNWHAELSASSRGLDAPLFPATIVTLNNNGAFEAGGLSNEGWSGTGAVREAFRRAFKLAGLPYFNPHSLRNMLVHHAMALDLTAEAMKAWSLNLGHSAVMTTFTSYGHVSTQKQGELIRSTRKPKGVTIGGDAIAELEAVLVKMKASAIN